MKKIGLALGGGAARGYAHLAIIKRFIELGIAPSYVSGASVGSLMGAYYCLHGEVDGMLEVAKSMKARQYKALLDPARPHRSLFKGEKVITWLRERFFGDATFDDLGTPLVLSSVDLERYEPYYIDTGDLVKGIRASASLPGIFPPYEYQGRVLMDGGVADPLPVNILFQRGVDKVIAINLNKYSFNRPMKKRNQIEVLTSTFYLMMRFLSEGDWGPEVFQIAPHFSMYPHQALDFLDISSNLKAGEDAVNVVERELLEWLDE